MSKDSINYFSVNDKLSQSERDCLAKSLMDVVTGKVNLKAVRALCHVLRGSTIKTDKRSNIS